MSQKKPLPSRSQVEFVRHAFSEYGSDLHQFLVHRLHGDQDARDLAQEVYLRLLRFGNADLVREPHAYVFHVACQVVGQHRLKNRRDPVTFDSDAVQTQAENAAEPHRDTPMEQLDAQHQLTRLMAQLATLSPTHRKVITLRRWKGASRTEIAQELKLSVHTVKKYIAEANARLALALWND